MSGQPLSTFENEGFITKSGIWTLESIQAEKGPYSVSKDEKPFKFTKEEVINMYSGSVFPTTNRVTELLRDERNKTLTLEMIDKALLIHEFTVKMGYIFDLPSDRKIFYQLACRTPPKAFEGMPFTKAWAQSGRSAFDVNPLVKPIAGGVTRKSKNRRSSKKSRRRNKP